MNKVQTETAALYATQAADHEEAIIQQALDILESKLRYKSDAFTAPELSKQFFRLKLQRLEHEVFAVAFLDNQHFLISYEEMFRGTIDGASVYPREVAKRVLELNAAAVIFSHNHPSGISTPSNADQQITSKLKSALNLFDVRVLDHIIIGDETYSFAQSGLI
jgi:DNA repair protein RadC